MHPVHSGKDHLNQSHCHSGPDRTTKVGLIRRWLNLSIRKWQRRRMIAALSAMDTRLLQDIGVERCDIERVVDGFDERELRMVPLAPSYRSVEVDRTLQQAA